MAITIISQPQAVSPVRNPVLFVCTSDHAGLQDFRYVFDVYPSGSADRIARIRRVPEPGSERGVIDLRGLLADYVSADMPVAGRQAGFYIRMKSSFGYELRAGEEYGAVPVVYPDLALAEGTAWSAGIEKMAFESYQWSDYRLSSGEIRKLHTHAPRVQRIGREDNAWIDFAMGEAGTVAAALFTTINETGTVTGSLRIENPFASEAQTFQRLACGPYQINLYQEGWLDSAAAAYTVQLTDAGGDAVAPACTFRLMNRGRYAPVRLHFLNALGGFDAFSFRQLNRERIDIKRRLYRKNTGDGEEAAVWHNEVNRLKRASSGWLSEEECCWLQELVTSTQVYWEAEKDTLVPVVLDNDTYEIRKKENDKLFSLEVGIRE